MAKVSALGSAAQRVGAAAKEAPLVSTVIALVSAVIFLILLPSTTKTRPVIARLPVWLPVEVAATAHLVTAGGLGGRILSLLRRNTGSLFGLTSTHQTLYDVQEVDRIFADAKRLKSLPTGFSLYLRVFGGSTDPAFEAKLEACHRQLYPAIERIFLNEANATAILESSDIPGRAARLVTFCERADEREQWERSADCRLVAPDAVEASLHELARDFGSCIAIPLLYGRDFLARYETLLADLWKFDNDAFALRVVGAPSWLPLRAFREGLRARERLKAQIAALYARIDQHQRGEPVDFGADMSDVSLVGLERNRVYREHGIEMHRRGAVDLTLLWGQNANTQPLVFWLLAHIYATPGLVGELRAELAAHVRVVSSPTGGRPEIASLDIPALSRDCPLFKSCLFETYRLCVEATSIRYVVSALTFSEGGHTHSVPAGSFLSAALAARQRDPAVYPEPDRFVPDRFLVTDAETGGRAARYGKLKPWGAGHGSCKGRTFAEREILAVAASVVALWDMEPAGGGEWKLPGMRSGTGTMSPLAELRVVLRRRKAVV